MKAAVLESAPGDLVVVDDVEHDAVGPREVLVQTGAAGVCHSDLHYMQGKYRTRMPTVVGHEAAGVVLEVGSDVTYVKPCLLYTSPSPRDRTRSRMPSSA